MKEDIHVRETAQAMKQKFLEQAAPLVEQYVAAALGVADFVSLSTDAREEVWDVLKKMMLQSSEKIEIDIKTAQDVITAVTEGKCTMEEGKQLLELYKSVKSIETMGSIEGATGLTINILQASTPKTVTVEPMKEVLEHES